MAADGKSVIVAGEGTWSVDGTTGAITFTPEAGFTGDPTPISYTVDDNTGAAPQAVQLWSSCGRCV
ncbi:Ig-like domain-containing protein [Psychrobacter fjordensis]|uniref:Ig-like domain-containing protein n=1 Tax=Psychrobacter fjordensis TaxID=664424 RepID=UPI00387A51AE